MVVALIALGANLPSIHGTPKDGIKIAAKIAANKIGDSLVLSSLWWGAPVPASNQPWYVNAAMSVETDRAPKEIMSILHEIEREFGRIRSENQNDARQMDLDLLDYDGMILNERGGLILPHPRMAHRDFVLKPLAQIAPKWRHPKSGESIQDLLSALPESKLEELV